jgi:hypothetical protein
MASSGSSSGATGKTAKKTAKPSPRNGNVLPLGAHPGNTGGKPGRSGRPPSAFKDFLAKLRANPGLHEALEAAACDPKSRGFAATLKLLSDYDTDKPAEKRQIVGPVEVRVKIVREGRRVTAS